MVNREQTGKGQLQWSGPLLLVLVFVIHAVLINGVADDALISLQYVKHFLLGDGLVYNIDERVEGFTNFLWLATLGGVMSIVPAFDLYTLSRVLGVCCGGLTILGVCHFSRNVCGERGAWSLLAGAFLAGHTSFVGWSTSGLETVMFAALVFAAAYSYVHYLKTGRNYLLPAVLFALVPMARPDGFLLAGLTGTHFVYWEWRQRGRLEILRPVIWAVVFFSIFGCYYAWRFSYYGELMPNTFYAKVMGGDAKYWMGWKYVRAYLLMHGALVFAPVIWLLLRRAREAWQIYFAILIGFYVAYIIAVGGDGLHWFRFFAQIVPLVYLLVAAGWAETYRDLRERFTAPPDWAWKTAVFGLVAVAMVYNARHAGRTLLFPESYRWTEPHSELTFPGDGTLHDYVWFENYFIDRQAEAARWLEENAAPNSLVASTPAGAIAYFMNHRVIDMLGLNDYYIARTEPGKVGFLRAGHMKGDGAYVLSRKPDYILMGNVAVLSFPLDEEKMATKLIRKSEHELWQAPGFHRDYELRTIRLHEAGPFQYFSFYQRRPEAG